MNRKPNLPCLILIAALFLSYFNAASQTISNEIVGIVSDEGGAPVFNASVIVRNNASKFSAGTTTDSSGRFYFNNLPLGGPYSFEISAINYEPQILSGYGIKSKDVISIAATLKLILNALNEVVVIGYGTQNKKDLTSAVASVKAKDLVITQGPEIGNMLKGKVAGLTIRQNSAQPGGGLDILVRGAGSVMASNSPLIVVDGFPITELNQPDNGGRYQAGSQSILNSFNPNDIESIDVLKDASATAIYGARAANGVILINTKRGTEGKARVEYSVNYIHQDFKNPFDVLPLNEWMQVRNEAAWEQWNFDNQVEPYGTRTLEEALANPLTAPYRRLYTQNAIDNVGRGTDWISLVTRNGRTIQHNITVSGGTSGTQYLLSGNYYNQDGIIKNSGFDRYSLRANVDQKISKYIKLGLNLTASRINNNNSQLGGDQYENSGIIRAAIQQGPHIPAIDENGNYPLNPQLSLQPNPYSLLTITDKGRIERMLVNTYLDVTPVKDLLIKLKVGMDRGYSERSNYLPRTTIHGALEQGKAAIAQINKDDYLAELTANYTKKIADAHKFDLLAGMSSQTLKYESNSSGNTGFITDAFLWHNLNAGSGTKTLGSYASENSFASYFGRVSYNYKDRYLLTGTLRTDGASVFARNHKWGTFPSIAFGWNVAEEPFFESLSSHVNMLKFRLGYGKTGNASIGSNAFAAYSAFPAWLSGNDNINIGVALSRLENPDLKWETTTETNLGLDFSILHNSIEGSIDLYQKVISDLLAIKSLNSYHEVNSVIANIGKTQSRGFEISIRSRNIQTTNFLWRTIVNVSKYKDTWKERAPDWKPSVYESYNDPIRPMYSRISDGILQMGENIPASQPELRAGMIRILDIDGFVRDGDGNPVVDENGRFLRTGASDGIIDDADTRLLGTSDPALMAGLTNIIAYKNFSLNFDFNGLFGRRMADPNFTTYGITAYGIYSNGYNALRTVKDRWTPENPSTTQPSSYYGFSPYGIGDFFLQKAWFIRLQNVSLGYTLPRNILRNIVSDIKINIGAQNLFVITPYNGVDPETDSYTAAYPNLKSYNMGITVTF